MQHFKNCIMYLDDVNWLFCVLLKQQHGGSVCVYVKLPQEPSVVHVALVHEAKTNIVSEGKRC